MGDLWVNCLKELFFWCLPCVFLASCFRLPTRKGWEALTIRRESGRFQEGRLRRGALAGSFLGSSSLAFDCRECERLAELLQRNPKDILDHISRTTPIGHCLRGFFHRKFSEGVHRDHVLL